MASSDEIEASEVLIFFDIIPLPDINIAAWFHCLMIIKNCDCADGIIFSGISARSRFM